MARGEGEATGSGFQARCGAVALITIGAGLDDDAYEAMGRLIAGEPPVGMSGPFDRLREGDVAGAGAIEEDELEELDENGVEELEENGESDPALSLTPKGEETLSVIHALRRWMSRRPRGPGRLGARLSEAGPGGGEALASLVCSWLATVTHALAAEPMTVAELERAIGRLGVRIPGEEPLLADAAGAVAAAEEALQRRALGPCVPRHS